jgi:ribonucleoside-diphosphate reductase subunit M2
LKLEYPTNMTTKEDVEPITQISERVSVIPTDPKYKFIWNNYQLQMMSFWVPGKIKFTDDYKAFQLMPPDLQASLLMVLSFFAGSDELVADNLQNNFLDEIKVPEIQKALRYQIMMEDIHSTVYNLNIQALVLDEKKRDELHNARKTSKTVKAKSDWAKKWYASGRPLRERIAAATAVEGIHFSSSFAFIDWLKTQKYGLKGTYDANHEISRDEAQHTRLGALIHMCLVKPIQREIGIEILNDAMKVEYGFIDEVLPAKGYIGMNRDMMQTHVRHCTNIIAIMLGIKNAYGLTHCPFVFMTKRSLSTKDNFFEEEGMQYNQADVTTDSTKSTVFSTDTDF